MLGEALDIHMEETEFISGITCVSNLWIKIIFKIVIARSTLDVVILRVKLNIWISFTQGWIIIIYFKRHKNFVVNFPQPGWIICDIFWNSSSIIIIIIDVGVWQNWLCAKWTIPKFSSWHFISVSVNTLSMVFSETVHTPVMGAEWLYLSGANLTIICDRHECSMSGHIIFHMSQALVQTTKLV